MRVYRQNSARLFSQYYRLIRLSEDLLDLSRSSLSTRLKNADSCDFASVEGGHLATGGRGDISGALNRRHLCSRNCQQPLLRIRSDLKIEMWLCHIVAVKCPLEAFRTSTYSEWQPCETFWG